MIGATAIAFSLIMFAMQVNVERMPHGLFRKFSMDWKLLGSFILSFLLAIFITILSLISKLSLVAPSLLVVIGSTVTILILFLLAYRRALRLISPTEQLKLISENVNKNFKAWDRRAKRAVPLCKEPEPGTEDCSVGSTHDMARFVFFKLNPDWTIVANQGAQHAISFARRYAEQRDYEISGAALNTIAVINVAYVKTKGKTFFDNYPLVDNPFANDSFIANTLEHLRQNIQIGISRGDEQLITQTLRTLAYLCKVYLDIDYSTEGSQAGTLTNLANSYLCGAVEAVAPHNMPDVLMDGVRLMGEVAHDILLVTDGTSIVTLCDKIALISCVGVAKEAYRPVTLIGIEQLAKLTLTLIRSQIHDIRFISKNISEKIQQVALLFLKVPDTPLVNIHSTYLAPYYSGSSYDTLQVWLADLANAISDANLDDKDAKKVIKHIEQWSDQVYINKKELLLAAIEKKSQFTFDVIHWISQITQTLLAVSNANACEDYARDKLRKNALWLISVLSWIPDDQESISFVEHFQLAETLFEVGLDAHSRQCEEIASKTNDFLVSWAFKAGKYQTGWNSFTQTLYALVALSLERGQDDMLLIAVLAERLGKKDAPSDEIRTRTARDMREQAATLYKLRHSLGSVQHSMERADSQQLQTFLEEVACQVSPETSVAPV